MINKDDLKIMIYLNDFFKKEIGIDIFEYIKIIINKALKQMKGETKMEFIKINENKWLVKDTNGIIVDNLEKTKLERNELILKDFTTNGCTKNIDKEIKEKNEIIKKTNEANKRHSKSKQKKD